MAVSVTNQFHIFLLSFLSGALAGVFFDLFRAFRRLVQSRAVWVGVQDILFWLFSAAAAFLFLYRTNYGEPRWYIFFGILLGALLYHLLLQDWTVRFFMALARLLGRVLRCIIRILVFPLYILYRILRPVFFFLQRIFRTASRFIRRKFRSFWVNFLSGVKKIKKIRKMY
ncbi:MAG: spore cortex biosynthesis protein YabQ [Ruminococcaceae bacterium]|nr:spore cortex biosynthesis protein YabQ [Oscillospiraceae bacterium]